MREKIEELVRQALADAQAAGELPEFQIDDVGLERPQDPSNGDWSSTVAMRSAKLAHKAPRDIAAALVAHIAKDAQIERVEVAGPGFVNFYLSTAAGNEIFNTVRKQDVARRCMLDEVQIVIEVLEITLAPLRILVMAAGQRWEIL